MVCMLAMAYFSIMNLLAEVKLLLLVKSQEDYLELMQV